MMKRRRIDSPVTPAARNSSSAPLSIGLCGSESSVNTNTNSSSSSSSSINNGGGSAAITMAGIGQRVEKRGASGNVVVNSPYGTSRSDYGWGDLFRPPLTVHIAGYPKIYIGTSSLNSIQGKDRRMSTLLAHYRKKFHSLEHCYTYHNISDEATWNTWKEMCVPHSSEVGYSSHSASTDAKRVSLLIKGKDDSDGTERNCKELLAMRGDSADRQHHHFIYTIKANQFLTHTRMLAIDTEVEEHIVNFFARRCPRLEPHLGPVLLQLPPQFHKTTENIHRLEGVAARILKTIRIAVEFRHRSWYCEETYDLLRRLGWALVVVHHHNDPTGSVHVDTGVPFMYVRLHGAIGPHVGDYGPERLLEWAELIVKFIRGGTETRTAGQEGEREVFFFFTNGDSHIGGATSSTVDATCLAEKVRMLLKVGEEADTVIGKKMKDIHCMNNDDIASVDDVTVISD